MNFAISKTISSDETWNLMKISEELESRNILTTFNNKKEHYPGNTEVQPTLRKRYYIAKFQMYRRYYNNSPQVGPLLHSVWFPRLRSDIKVEDRVFDSLSSRPNLCVNPSRRKTVFCVSTRVVLQMNIGIPHVLRPRQTGC